MRVVLSAGGRFHAFHLAKQLARRNSLAKFFSFSAQNSDFDYLPRSVVDQSTVCKFVNWLACRLQVRRFVNKSWCNATQDALFDTWVAKKIQALEPFDIFVGWADYVLKTIPFVRQKGAKVIIESGSFHIKDQAQLLTQEYDRWGICYEPINKKNMERMLAEYELADYIMTPSEVVCQSFYRQGVARDKVLKVPCGIDGAPLTSLESRDTYVKKFIVLFAGLLSIRKGVPYLIQAWNELNLPDNDAELLLVGGMQKDCEAVLKRLPMKKNVKIMGSVSHQQLKKLYQQATVLALPSIDEGFGMVVTEAMASGIPVICSDHVGAGELVQDYQQGFIVPHANVQALAACLAWCYQHREACFEMGRCAQQTVKSLTWDHYGQQVYSLYQQILNV
ncbi:MAG: glycosyltransferase family 4 protein [Epsilonproteobacteria bacterium]|nr:glycosyltransferase family 4 protein [Campylobacterota bacterium]